MSIKKMDTERSGTEADSLLAEVNVLLPRLAEARRRYAATMSDADWLHLEAVQNEAAALQARFYETVSGMETDVGLSSELLEKIGELQPGTGHNHLPRRNLTREKIAITGEVEEYLHRALNVIQHLLPAHWIDAAPPELCRLDNLARQESFLSLTKGLRQESQAPATHRFRQALRVTQDYLSEHSTYDHFAGATLVPSVAQLGSLRWTPKMRQLAKVEPCP